VAVADFLQEKRKEIDNRLKELGPAVEEHRRLEAAAKALESIQGSTNGAPAATPRAPAATPRAPARRRGPGRPRGSKSAVKATPVRSAPAAKLAAKRRAGRRKGSGKRGSEALAIIQEQPGVTIPEIASKMGIKQNYLYRILPDLEQAGSVRKEKRGWHPVAARAAA
jgi:uncharacterized membrane protein